MEDTDKTKEQLKRELAKLRQKIAKLLDERNLMRTLIDNLPKLIYIKDTDSSSVRNLTNHNS